jgi:hypothetical protein
VPLVGFHDGNPDDVGKSDKQDRFDDHLFNTFSHPIEDRPATVVIKIEASTRSDTINGRCDIFEAPARRLEQFERCHAAGRTAASRQNRTFRQSQVLDLTQERDASRAGHQNGSMRANAGKWRRLADYP